MGGIVDCDTADEFVVVVDDVDFAVVDAVDGAFDEDLVGVGIVDDCEAFPLQLFGEVGGGAFYADALEVEGLLVAETVGGVTDVFFFGGADCIEIALRLLLRLSVGVIIAGVAILVGIVRLLLGFLIGVNE